MTVGPPPDGPVERLRWLATTDHPWVQFGREVLTSVGAVALVGLLLFAASGVWPPLVAVQSPSMEPHLHRGDLVFVMDSGRLVPEAAVAGTGVVTYQGGREAGYRTFGSYGDVVIFDPPAENGPPIIHRARFYVEADENWYDRADPSYIRATECGDTQTEGLRNCPAPHAGFITRGDANPVYDQVSTVSGPSGPIKPIWVKGTAEVRVPYLGYVRLWYAEVVEAAVG